MTWVASCEPFDANMAAMYVWIANTEYTEEGFGRPWH